MNALKTHWVNDIDHCLVINIDSLCD